MYKTMHLDKRQDVATNTNVDTKFSAHDDVSGITFHREHSTPKGRKAN